MTERKPAGIPVRTWVDQLIAQAQERGARLGRRRTAR